jgi:glucan 1,3-beta-glucosidase
MPSFLWSNLLIVAIQTLPVFTFAIDRSLNASVDAQVTLLGWQDPSYWLADIIHQGVAVFNPDSTYQVFRNVKGCGARGLVQATSSRLELSAERSL